MDKRVWSWLAVVAATLLAWLSAFVGGLPWLVTPAFLVLMDWLGRNRFWRPLATLLLASPFAVACGFAALSYARGVAHFWTTGLPDATFHNVDPSTRYQSTSSGCIVNGSEWVLHLPNNATLRALHFLFGPMPGAYDGPYPSGKDIQSALASASPLDWQDLELDTVSVDQSTIPLRRGVGSNLVAALQPRSNQPHPSIALWQGRVLLLRFPASHADLAAEAALVVLVDRDTGKVIAYEGHIPSSPGNLPKPWA